MPGVPKIMEKFIILSNQEVVEMQESDMFNIANNRLVDSPGLPVSDYALKILP